MASEAHERGLAPVQDAADEPLNWQDAMRRRQTRVRLIGAGVVAALLVVGVVVLMLSAASHYQRGRDAMAARHFGAAVEEFAAARVLTVWYRDAQSLGAHAQQALELDAQHAEVLRQERSAVSRLLRDARGGITAHKLTDTVAALREARVLVPEGPIGRNATQQAAASELATMLTASGAEAMKAARWEEAARAAQAWLILEPTAQDATDLAQRAATAQGLQQDLGAAEEAAGHGRWREALRLSKGVEREWAGFPGAGALIARAQKALAPKPKPKASATTAPAPAPVETVAPPPAPAPIPPPP